MKIQDRVLTLLMRSAINLQVWWRLFAALSVSLLACHASVNVADLPSKTMTISMQCLYLGIQNDSVGACMEKIIAKAKQQYATTLDTDQAPHVEDGKHSEKHNIVVRVESIQSVMNRSYPPTITVTATLAVSKP